MAHQLLPETAALVTPLFEEQGAEHLFAHLFGELKATNPVLAQVIGDEALRLFGDNTELRARATRFVLEILHIQNVSDFEAQLPV